MTTHHRTCAVHSVLAGGRRCLLLAGAALLLPGVLATAQQAAAADVTHRPLIAAAQQKPLPTVRPAVGRQTQWRGTPWIANPQENTLASLGPAGELDMSVKPQPASDGSTRLGVSGWWTIEVKNPDGSAALHREIENDFDSTPFMVYLLSGMLVAGEAAIDFRTNGSDPSAGSPCLGTYGCQISETSSGLWAAESNCTQYPQSCSTNLTRSVGTATPTILTYCNVTLGGCVVSNPTLPAFELNGSITSQVSNNIGFLESRIWACSASGAVTSTSPSTALNPASCISAQPGSVAAQSFRLTFLNLASPIAVTAGQVVSIKLDISFIGLPPQTY